MQYRLFDCRIDLCSNTWLINYHIDFLQKPQLGILST